MIENNTPAEGNFSGKPYYPEQPKNMKEFDRQSNKNLQPYNRKVVNTDYFTLLKYAVGILAIGVLVFGYMAYNGKLSDKISCPTFSCPEIPANVPCPSNNLSCGNLDCGDVIIPSSFNVNLTNGTG